MARHDIIERFGRTHLSTPAELATYQTLHHRRHGFISADEIARDTGLPVDQVEPVLRSFTEVGILHEVWLGLMPAYRRRPEIDYLPEDGESEPTDVDPVCGMLVPDDSPHEERDPDGPRTRFCSSRCRAAYIAFPGLFAAEAG